MFAMHVISSIARKRLQILVTALAIYLLWVGANLWKQSTSIGENVTNDLKVYRERFQDTSRVNSISTTVAHSSASTGKEKENIEFPRKDEEKIITEKSPYILSSEWIKFFPKLEKLVKILDAKERPTYFKESTDAKFTTLKVEEKKKYVVGQRVSAIIKAKNHFGKDKEYGGDFFFVTLRRPGKPNDGIYCEVEDHMTGYYNVSCLMPWAGEAEINARMFYPSEAIYLLMQNSSSPYKWIVRSNTTMLNSKGKKEYTRCAMDFPGEDENELCEYKDNGSGEVWKCLKPPSGECSVIIWQDNSANTPLRKYSIYDISPLFKLGVTYDAPITGSGIKLNVAPSANGASAYNPETKDNWTVKDNIASPSGWFYDSRWTSMKVSSKEYSVDFLRNCVKNKDLYFFGDSTLRQLFYFFIQELGVRDHGPDNSVAWAQPRDGRGEWLNCSFHYRSHGSPLHNMGPPSSRHYVANSFDSITKGGEGTVVIFNLGQHFNTYDPDFLGRRLHRIKEAVVSYMSRLPGAKVFIKGLHTYEPIDINPSGWFCYRYNVMLLEEFKDIEGLVFMDMWDFMYVQNNNNVHPAHGILRKQVGLILSYMCEE